MTASILQFPKPARPLQALAVYTSAGDGLYYTCRWDRDPYRWTCGKCGKGLLGPSPKKGDRCPECSATVVGVQTEMPISIRFDLRSDLFGW